MSLKSSITNLAIKTLGLLIRLASIYDLLSVITGVMGETELAIRFNSFSRVLSGVIS